MGEEGTGDGVTHMVTERWRERECRRRKMRRRERMREEKGRRRAERKRDGGTDGDCTAAHSKYPASE